MLSTQETMSHVEHAASMSSYIREGEQRALALNNRGPIQYTADGSISPEILDSYWQHGFYVLENVVGEIELKDLRDDLADLLARAPAAPGSKLDANGAPAAGIEFEILSFLFAKPLSDPLGGTDKNQGRHPIKMSAPEAAENSPDWTIELAIGNLQLMDACLRHYGHPDLLRMAEAINGPDFVPYNEVVFLKEPGFGPSVAWHQDGITHWQADDWHQGIHGFNFMTQLYPSTAANGVWVLPGSHKLGKVDITALMHEAGSERLEGATPMICNSGDVIIMNRQLVHGSFANTSPDRRATVNAGFFPLKSVLNVTTKQLSGKPDTYDAARIEARSKIIQLGIDARSQRYGGENQYQYAPLAAQQENLRFNEQTRISILKNYNLRDMFI